MEYSPPNVILASKLIRGKPSSAVHFCVFLVQFQEEIYVARAPGRLDVMGGIADYSGSFVLQVIYVAIADTWI